MLRATKKYKRVGEVKPKAMALACDTLKSRQSKNLMTFN